MDGLPSPIGVRNWLLFLGALAALLLPAGAVSAGTAAGGDQLWAARYDDRLHGGDAANSVAVNPDGSRVFVTGPSFGPSGSDDYVTVGYDAATGTPLWLRRYAGPSGNDTPTSVAVSPDGSKVLVTGYSYGVGGNTDFATVAYDATTGAVTWARRYNGPANGYDYAYGLAVSSDGSEVFVTGSAGGTTGIDDYATVAYDAYSGGLLWAKRYNGPGNANDIAWAVAASPDGSRAFVTGFSDGATSNHDYATIAYDAKTGDRVWARRYNGPGNFFDEAYSIHTSPDGSRVFVTGYSYGTVGGADYATIAYDSATGASMWGKRYNGLANGSDVANSLAVSPDGSKVFVTGYSSQSDQPTDVDYATLAYDAATGAALWAKLYDGPAHEFDVAKSIASSPDGSQVFVTGYGPGVTTGNDYATLSYQAVTGAPLWKARYDGPSHGSDQAHGIAVSPDGSTAFVTGQSDGGPTSIDYATLAYEA